jgi:hypothetical protein
MAVIEALGNGLPVVFAECPALEELSDRPAWAFKTNGSLCRALDAALATVGNRHPVPPELLKRYSIEHAAAGVDEVYRQLVSDRD